MASSTTGMFASEPNTGSKPPPRSSFDLRSFASNEDGNDHELDDESDESENQDHHGEEQQPGTVRKQRLGNACLSCRRQKTRCEYLEGHSKCKLCSKYNRECVKAPPRRRRQKTTTRISDLEQKIQTLTSLLEKNPAAMKASKQANSSSFSNKDGPTFDHSEPDVVEAGLVDKITAEAAFQRFRSKMSQYFPFVIASADIAAEDFRKQKPLLFSMMVLAGISTIQHDLHPKLADHMLRNFADRILYRAERSLELVQCLLLHVCYYSRTLKKRDLNFYQLIHIASTMALDLGYGRREVLPRVQGRIQVPPEDTLDGRRAWLGCYYLAGQAALNLRHPIFVRWSKYTEECLEVISSHPNAAPSDPWLCDLVQIHRIAEDAHFIFSMDDPASVICLKDPKIQYQLAALEQQLERWRENAKTDTNIPFVRNTYAHINLYIHEIALHTKHNIDRFRSPPALEEVTSLLQDFDLSPARIDSLCICLESIHCMFDTILGLDLETTRNFSNLYFVRLGYASLVFKALADLCDIQATSAGQQAFPRFDVQFDAYMNAIVRHLLDAGRDNKSNVAFAFGMVLQKVKSVRQQRLRSLPVKDNGRHNFYEMVQEGLLDVGEPEQQPTPDSNAELAANRTASNTYAPSSNYPNPEETIPIQQQFQHQQTHHSGSSRPSLSPSQYDFHDLDTNMWDVNSMQFFNPNFNLGSLYNQAAQFFGEAAMISTDPNVQAGMPSIETQAGMADLHGGQQVRM